MIRLGLRLTVKGGREAAARLVVTAVAVALGVGMLLITLAGINGVNAQNARYAWLETGSGPTASLAAGPPSSADPLWWLLTPDEFHGQLIGRVDVAATGPHSPVPPGIPVLPGPGQYYASPRLSVLLRTTPADQLAARYPGRQIGTIGASALPAPNSLLIIVGRTASQLASLPGASRITQISTTPPSSCNGACYYVGINSSGIDLVLTILAAAVLFPVLIFIGTASRLSAAHREQRFAAMRLVGATPRQISVIAAVESTVAAVTGMAVGFGLFYLLRPVLASIPFTGAPFYTSDLSLNPLDVLTVAIGVPVAAAVAARLALRRVQVSPLGVTRRTTPRPPRACRLLPLLAGLGELAYFVEHGRPSSTPAQIEAFLPGFLLIMVGLVASGPWVTMIGSTLLARRTARPAVLIAGRRLSDNPSAGFRAISGLVLALFVTSVGVGVITAIDAESGGPTSGPGVTSTVVDQFLNFLGPASDARATSVAAISPALSGRLNSIPGVRAMTVVHRDPQAGSDNLGPPPGLVLCSELAHTPAMGRCATGAKVARVAAFVDGRSFRADRVWPSAAFSPTAVQRLPVATLAVDTDGSRAAVERVRTDLEQALPYYYLPATIAEQSAQNPNTKLDAQYQRLVDVVILASLPIAGCSLAVSVAAGLSDRKRPFSLLRLAGSPLSVLRRVVALESAVPLIAVSVVSIGIGFLAAGLFLTAQLHESIRPPGVGYYLTVSAGLLASLGIIASTFPLLGRLTGPETARNE